MGGGRVLMSLDLDQGPILDHPLHDTVTHMHLYPTVKMSHRSALNRDGWELTISRETDLPQHVPVCLAWNIFSSYCCACWRGGNATPDHLYHRWRLLRSWKAQRRTLLQLELQNLQKWLCTTADTNPPQVEWTLPRCMCALCVFVQSKETHKKRCWREIQKWKNFSVCSMRATTNS